MEESWSSTNGNSRKTSTMSQNYTPSEPVFRTASFTGFRPKLLLKSPSPRAMTMYNNISTKESNSYDNLSFLSMNDNDTVNSNSKHIKNHYNNMSNYCASLMSDTNTSEMYDYTTMRSFMSPTPSGTISELDSDKNDMGSTVRLVPSKMEMTCQTWLGHFTTVLCTISLAANVGNLYRLPQMTLSHGGLPFAIAYIVLTILLGIPLLFLELGIGQLAEDGFIKSWRAVPFFKGVGYVKLITGCLLSVYYPIYMGLSVFYIYWMANSTLPFPECSSVTISDAGYSPINSKDRQQCIRSTFLESPFKDPFWYTIYGGILFLIWVMIILLTLKRMKSFTRSLVFLLFPTLACFIALIVKGTMVENSDQSLNKLINNIEWERLQNANIWYLAAIQVFFSTNVGFGTFLTNAGVIYQKVNPLWTALGYIFVNLLFGLGSIVLYYALSGSVDVNLNAKQITELHLPSLIYEMTTQSDVKIGKTWAIVAYSLFILVGFISMVTIISTLLKVITVESNNKLKWWQTSVVLCFFGFLSGCFCLLRENFQIIHLLDNYVVGNLILISTIIEMFALISFYGTERIRSDFEFMLGHILSKIWLIMWWIAPVMLTGIFVWTISTMDLDLSEWLPAVGWGVVLVAIVLVLAIGLCTVCRQDAYSVIEKFKKSFKPSNDWGPKDTMLRHAWVQWNTKIKEGERDFTFKRRGTRDYTRSIKKSTKKQNAAASDLSTISVSAIYQPQSSNQINTTSDNISRTSENTLTRQNKLCTITKNPQHVTSVKITSEEPIFEELNAGNFVKQDSVSNIEIEATGSEGYGTFRRGPFVINGNNVGHVCHRKYSQEEQATCL